MIFALPQRNQCLFYAAVPQNWTSYEPVGASDVASPVVFLHLMVFHKDGTAMKQRFIDRIAEGEFSTLVLGTFLRAVLSSPVARLSFARLNKHYNDYDALLRVL